MYRIDTTIEGIAPILFNRWTEEARHQLDTGTGGGKKTVEVRQDEAHGKVYRNGAGLYLPAHNLEKCIAEGATKAQLKRGKLMLAPFLAATVFCEGRELLFDREEPDGIHEVTGRRPPRTGGACIIRRPYLGTGWTLHMALQVMLDTIDLDQLHTALETAGLLVGLGDDRPRHGRFLVKEFKQV